MPKGKKRLLIYKVNQILYDEFVNFYKYNLINVDTIEPYFCGYAGTDLEGRKDRIVIDDKNELVCLHECLCYFCNELYADYSNWKQIILRLDESLDADTLYVRDIDGLDAWLYVNKIIDQSYTDSEKLERYQMFEADYDFNLIQKHEILAVDQDVIYKYDNCYKYDINGAHNDALCEIFPKCAKKFTDMFNKRKEKGCEMYKKYINYFVGMLCKKGHRLTYNWIVQRTTKMLNNAIKEVNGILLYANTDGFIVQDPEKLIDHSRELGKFKLEYSGQVRYFRTSNYFAYEIDSDKDRVKGSIRLCMRDKLDLKNNQVVYYKSTHNEITHSVDIYDVNVKYIKEEVKI